MPSEPLPLTFAALTALHSLSHRIGLTPAEEAALSSRRLGPELWAQTVAFLRDVDVAGPTARIDVGFALSISRWLGFADEAACAAHFGLSVGEALSRDSGSLTAIAAAVEGDGDISTEEAIALRASIGEVWSARAGRLGRLGHSEASHAVLAALDRALVVMPLPDDVVRSLWAELAGVCDKYGNRDVAAEARRRMDVIPAGEAPHTAARYLLFTVLWCITHGDLLLPDERELDRHVPGTREEWERIRAAVTEGRVQEVPLPTALALAWCTQPDIQEAELRACLEGDLEELRAVLFAVEQLWGGPTEHEIPAASLLLALSVLCIRRATLDTEYLPPEGERASVWYEVLQGARRSETLERSRLIWRLNAILVRQGDLDPTAPACVHLDKAAEAEATGQPVATREHLEAAHRLLRDQDDLDRREYGQVWLAQQTWAEGQPHDALAMLGELRSERARDLRTRIHSREEERNMLGRAARVYRRRADLESWCAVARAHMAAGHTFAAERTAKEICREHPARPLAWHTKARLLHEIGRHRDAVIPARMALSLGGDEPTGKALTARILSRIGTEGRKEAVKAAEDAIDGLVRRMDSPSEELSELADLVHGLGGEIEVARTADGYVWRHRDQEEPPAGWLGAAVARSCHSPWSSDAVSWVARLAEAAPDAPEELARWVADRVDYLEIVRLQVSTRVFGHRPPDALPRMSEFFERTFGYPLRCAGQHAAALAATSLGVHELEARAALSLTSEDTAGLPPPPVFDFQDAVSRWRHHLRPIATAFGTELAVRLRASEVAQRTFSCFLGRAEEAPFTVWEIVEREIDTWLRWAAQQTALKALVQGGASVLAPGTRERLERVLQMAALDNDGLGGQ